MKYSKWLFTEHRLAAVVATAAFILMILAGIAGVTIMLLGASNPEVATLSLLLGTMFFMLTWFWEVVFDAIHNKYWYVWRILPGRQ